MCAALAAHRPAPGALIAGERDPALLAALARGRLRSWTTRLTEPLTGRFTEHHAILLTRMLQRVDAVTADIATVQARIDARIGELAPPSPTPGGIARSTTGSGAQPDRGSGTAKAPSS